LAYII